MRVLVVCTANLCRSPLAEQLLRRALTERRLDWSVSSAGIAAIDGWPSHPLVQQVLRERGIAAGPQPPRRLTAEQVLAADLILTAEFVHRAAVVSLVPSAVQRTYPLLQFARFAGTVPAVEDPATLLTGVAAARTRLQPVVPELDTLADPVGQPIDAFRDCADVIERAVGLLLSPVRPAAAG